MLTASRNILNIFVGHNLTVDCASHSPSCHNVVLAVFHYTTVLAFPPPTVLVYLPWALFDLESDRNPPTFVAPSLFVCQYLVSDVDKPADQARLAMPGANPGNPSQSECSDVANPQTIDNPDDDNEGIPDL